MTTETTFTATDEKGVYVFAAPNGTTGHVARNGRKWTAVARNSAGRRVTVTDTKREWAVEGLLGLASFNRPA